MFVFEESAIISDFAPKLLAEVYTKNGGNQVVRKSFAHWQEGITAKGVKAERPWV